MSGLYQTETRGSVSPLPLSAQKPTLQLIHTPTNRPGLVLEDLGLSPLLDACILSEEEGIEKPNPEIWARGIRAAGLGSPPIYNGTIQPPIAHEIMHVGDELEW